jgi:hypothetical protein
MDEKMTKQKNQVRKERIEVGTMVDDTGRKEVRKLKREEGRKSGRQEGSKELKKGIPWIGR